MQEVVIDSIPELVKNLAAINRGKRALYRGQRRNLPLLPKVARLSTYLPLLEAEQAMIDDFKLSSIPYLEQQPDNDWEWLAVMQHYGLATRLLDWSANPLAALWFAVCNPPVENQNGVVWLYQPNREDYAVVSQHDNPLEINHIRLVKPRIIAARIGAQQGWFTIHPFDAQQEKFVALEALEAFTPRLTKLIVPSTQFARIRFELDRIGVNSASLFPDLAGLCTQIEWSYSNLADENIQTVDKSFVLPPKLG
jgi:hypothetical protein